MLRIRNGALRQRLPIYNCKRAQKQPTTIKSIKIALDKAIKDTKLRTAMSRHCEGGEFGVAAFRVIAETTRESLVARQPYIGVGVEYSFHIGE